MTAARDIDVLEIDGASNNGVDEIRVLLENVQFSPSRGKFKIYIIDEVHMLSAPAFNALLKTLEEPPAHVKFVFATTAPHKVLPTIMSRCQRFDFKKIPPKMILDRIMDIAGKEKIDIDEKAALWIARSADGSLRDALVILDQMVSFTDKKIMPEDVIELLGMVSKDMIFRLSGAIIDKSAKEAATTLDEIINNGRDPVFIANSLISHFRDLMILKTAGEPTSDMAFTEEELKELKAQLDKLTLEEILYILHNISHCLKLIKSTMFTRAPLEIALIRLTRREDVMSLAKVLAKLEEMEPGGYAQQGAFQADNTPTERAPAQEILHSELGFPTAAMKGKRRQTENYAIESEENDGASAPGGMSQANWKSVLNYVKSKKMSVFTFLSAGEPVEFSSNKITIVFKPDHSFNKDALETPSNKSVIEEAIGKVTGESPRLEFIIAESSENDDQKTAENSKKRASVREAMKPVIEKAMDVFGGHVVRDMMEGEP